jgi:hypothetical protein
LSPWMPELRMSAKRSERKHRCLRFFLRPASSGIGLFLPSAAPPYNPGVSAPVRIAASLTAAAFSRSRTMGGSLNRKIALIDNNDSLLASSIFGPPGRIPARSFIQNAVPNVGRPRYREGFACPRRDAFGADLGWIPASPVFIGDLCAELSRRLGVVEPDGPLDQAPIPDGVEIVAAQASRSDGVTPLSSSKAT